MATKINAKEEKAAKNINKIRKNCILNTIKKVNTLNLMKKNFGIKLRASSQDKIRLDNTIFSPTKQKFPKTCREYASKLNVQEVSQ